jgi:hypothetical protein
MTNVKPGYWDVDLCSWVAVAPSLPEPRVAADDEPVTTAEA